MFEPNLYTLTEDGAAYGLHRFADGEVYLAQQHSSGDWITLRPSTERDEQYFLKHGTAIEAPLLTRKRKRAA